MQMLYQWDVGGHSPAQVQTNFFLDRKVEPEVERFARELFEGAVMHREVLDRLMGEQAHHWRLERMAAVDRNILRLAIYELLHHPEVPPAAVIDEALEIARRFSGLDSVEFVNGVLDGIRKSLPPRNSKPL
jgi:transcription antitermination protein NusB